MAWDPEKILRYALIGFAVYLGTFLIVSLPQELPRVLCQTKTKEHQIKYTRQGVQSDLEILLPEGISYTFVDYGNSGALGDHSWDRVFVRESGGNTLLYAEGKGRSELEQGIMRLYNLKFQDAIDACMATQKPAD